jgi:hypothetical protein
MNEVEITDKVELVTKFINGTSGHIFLTGKAGTGKTTFLKMLASRTHKHFIVVAPTGIAALNAGGVTIHSQFLLPPGTYVPDRNLPTDLQAVPGVHTQSDLARKHPINSIRKNVLRAIDLLVIDEVSMLRADLLDAIDYRLRAVKGNYQLPFGGVQLLLIGDLYQLPPVVRRDEEALMRRYYNTPWFFESRGLKTGGFVFVELDKIYRQQDDVFIRLLNNLRNNIATPEDIQVLNRSFRSPEQISELKEVITLTTHNAKADELNQSTLRALKSPSFFYEAEIDGDFPENQYPVLGRMELKVGTQIMFIKNDTMGAAYFNGKLATVVELSDREVVVEMSGNHQLYTLKKEVWTNKKYNVNPESKELEEEIIGSFEQYPIRLAWAITVHKSQGLTFEKAIIDVGQAFADGQVYVALSRLRSLDGLVLRSQINPNVISTDKAVVQFSTENHQPDKLPDVLILGQRKYLRELLMLTFDFNDLVKELDKVNQEYKHTFTEEDRVNQNMPSDIADALRREMENTQKFRNQLVYLVENGENEKLLERLEKGSEYYVGFVIQNIKLLLSHIASFALASKAKTYLSDLNQLDQILCRKWQDMQKVPVLAKGIILGGEIGTMNDLTAKYKARRQALIGEMEVIKMNLAASEMVGKKKAPTKIKSTSKKKKDTGVNAPTVLETLALFKEGKTMEEIAALRSLAPGTIETHLTKSIESKRLDVRECMDPVLVDEITEIVTKAGEISMSEIFNAHEGKYSYGQLRMVKASLNPVKED